MDITSLKHLIATRLERRDRLQRDAYRSITRCCGGEDINASKELEDEIEKLKAENIEFVRDFHKISVKLTTVEQEKDTLEREVKRLEQQLEDKEEEKKVFETKLDEVNKAIEEKNQTILVIRQESSAHQINRIKLQDDLTRLNTENHRIMDQYARLEQELRVTKDLYSKMKTLPQQPTPMTRNVSTITPRTTPLGQASVATSELPTNTYRQIAGHTSDILCIRFNADGTMAASASADKTIKIWDVANGKLKNSLSGAMQSFTHVSFSGTGDMLLGTSNDCTAKIWHLANWRLKHSLTGHAGKITCGEFFDADKVMTGSHDRTLKVWDLGKGYCVKTSVCYSSCNALMMGGMNNMVITGHCDNTVRFWDLRSKDCVEVNKNYHTGSVSDVVRVLDGRYFVTIGKDNVIQYVDGINRNVISTFSDSEFSVTTTSRICVSPDGRYIVAGNSNGDVFCWDVNTKKLEHVLKPKMTTPAAAGCLAVTWSPAHSQLLSGYANKIMVWEGTA